MLVLYAVYCVTHSFLIVNKSGKQERILARNTTKFVICMLIGQNTGVLWTNRRNYNHSTASMHGENSHCLFIFQLFMVIFF